MRDLISVIVPAYNSASYIMECTKSVLAQTYADWELIIIDDGSQDMTAELCMDLCGQDERIRFLSQEHRGVSAARNTGIEAARGKYLFFLDSDDTIHPNLIETLYRLMEKSKAAVGSEYFLYEKGDIFLRSGNRAIYLRNHEAIHAFLWKVSEMPFNGIGGKMIRRDSIGELKFDDRFSHGEDTLFLYQMLAQGADIIILPLTWYYYRNCGESASGIYSAASIQSRYRVWKYIRNMEIRNGRYSNAVRCEEILLSRMSACYIEIRHGQDEDAKRYIKALMDSEKNTHIFPKTDWRIRLRVWLMFYRYPVYWIIHIFLRAAFSCVDAAKRLIAGSNEKDGEEKSSVGILTFHCADNYGAMLQACGLKQYLRGRGIKADIVRYEPFFMTGRHWWIPYYPHKNFVRRIWYAADGWVQNLKMGKAYFARRKNMKFFRERFLVEKRQKKLFFLCQLKELPYSDYIVGSDQIWNPEITCGLRKAYFGAFENRKKEKVVAYAASLGGASLPSEYDEKLSRLLRCVDVVSVREKEAVPYIQDLYGGSVTAVLDPTLLLDREEWQRMEKLPDRAGYILVYMTERNETLVSFTKKLSAQKNLPIVELRGSAGVTDKDFLTDYWAGPAEFLGYVHKADYVVTNSFHGTVFSIIFQKRFIVFQHSRLGARIYNVLRIHGLEQRLWGEGNLPEADDFIDWGKVKKRTEENVKVSEEFLLKYVGK